MSEITEQLRSLTSEMDPEVKQKFNAHVKHAKELELSNKFSGALAEYKVAHGLFSHHPKLPSKIKKLEEKVSSLSKIAPQQENLLVSRTTKRTSSTAPTSAPKVRPEFKDFTYDSEKDRYSLTSNSNTFTFPADLFTKLYSYQVDGIAWFCRLHEHKGYILADDMGLGKTVQISLFINGLFQSKLASHIIIGMPVSLIQNWKKELTFWASKVPVYQFHNVTPKQRTDMLQAFNRKGGVLLTTYGMFTSQNENFEKHLDKVDYIFLDEGHKIKNPTIKLSQNIRKIASKHKVILTGTPVQNDVMEMWALFDYIFDGQLLGTSRMFATNFARVIERGNQRDATPYEKKLGIEVGDKFRSIIGPYFLRREKSKVLSKDQGLSAQKNDFIVWIHLEQAQLDFYQQYIRSDNVFDVLNKTSNALSALTILKQICDHPLLLKKDEWNLKEMDMKRLISESGKLKFTIELLKSLIAEDHRVLIFSQSTKMLDILSHILKCHKMTFLRIDGSITDSRKRQDLIDKFNEDDSYNCFLLTTQTGGVGITLNAADRVIIFDPAWNPATDNQAVDRCYRIGQDKNVIVYRLITCSTIEEKIYRKQIFKDSLSKSATEKSNSYRYFSKDELSALFELEDPTTSQTQIQLAQLHEKERKMCPGLQEHVDDLTNKTKFGTVFGLSDHDLLFKQASTDQFDEEVMSDVIKSIQSLNVNEPKEKKTSSSTLTSKSSGKSQSIPAGQIKKTNISTMDKEKMYKLIRKHGEKTGWIKISQEMNHSTDTCKKMWEDIKSTTPYEEVVTSVLKYDMSPPWPEIARSMIMVQNRVSIAPKPIAPIATRPIVQPVQPVTRPSTVNRVVKNPLPVQTVTKTTAPVTKVSPVVVVKKNDDFLLDENLLSKSKKQEVIEITSTESTPVKVLVDKENQVPKQVVDPDLPIDVEEPEDSDDETVPQPEEILKEIVQEEGECPETPEQVGKRLSLCFGLLSSQPRKRLLVLSDDEEESREKDENPKKKYHDLLQAAFALEMKGELSSALQKYMDAFEISREDEKLAFKIKQLAIEIGLE